MSPKSRSKYVPPTISSVLANPKRNQISQKRQLPPTNLPPPHRSPISGLYEKSTATVFFVGVTSSDVSVTACATPTCQPPAVGEGGIALRRLKSRLNCAAASLICSLILFFESGTIAFRRSYPMIKRRAVSDSRARLVTALCSFSRVASSTLALIWNSAAAWAMI